MFLFLLFGGMAAGTLGGLLGIGGGILIMPILRFVLGLDPAHAAGTCIVAVFFTTLGGSLKHFKLGHINLRSILPVIISGLISSLIFSFVFIYFTKKDAWLDMATGIVFSLIALRMIWEGLVDYRYKFLETPHGKGLYGSTLMKLSVGGAAGLLPGLLGIGTGAVLVPAFSLAMNAPIKIAIGSSLACFSLNALVSSALKLFQGFARLDVLIPLCIGTLLGSQFGATLNERFSPPFLKVLFGVCFFYVAVKYILLF